MNARSPMPPDLSLRGRTLGEAAKVMVNIDEERIKTTDPSSIVNQAASIITARAAEIIRNESVTVDELGEAASHITDVLGRALRLSEDKNSAHLKIAGLTPLFTEMMRLDARGNEQILANTLVARNHSGTYTWLVETVEEKDLESDTITVSRICHNANPDQLRTASDVIAFSTEANLFSYEYPHDAMHMPLHVTPRGLEVYYRVVDLEAAEAIADN